MNTLIILVSNLASIIFAAASWHLCNQGKEGWGWMAGFAIATASSVNFRKETKPRQRDALAARVKELEAYAERLEQAGDGMHQYLMDEYGTQHVICMIHWREEKGRTA